MSLPLTSPIINFLVPDLHDLYTIGIADSSYYPSTFTVTDPTVEIIPPGFNTATLSYTIRELNVYNSNDLGLTCANGTDQLGILPDGLWVVRMSIAPNDQYSKTLNIMRTTNIRRKYGRAVMQTDIVNCAKDMKHQQMSWLDEISYYIDCATAAGNDCNGQLAMTLLRQASRMLDDFINNRPNFYLNPGYYLPGL